MAIFSNHPSLPVSLKYPKNLYFSWQDYTGITQVFTMLLGLNNDLIIELSANNGYYHYIG